MREELFSVRFEVLFAIAAAFTLEDKNIEIIRFNLWEQKVSVSEFSVLYLIDDDEYARMAGDGKIIILG